MKFLLIADDAWVVNDALTAITDPGWELETVSEPKRAAEAAAAGRPDLVLVDMQVGSMGGMAVIRLLEDAMATGRLPRIPVVLLLDRQADRFIARRSGASAFVEKPFTGQALRETVGRLLAAPTA